MPKDNIDYSQTIIYKIYCKDSTITDVYIGHTTNFIKRKYQHKICCNGNTKLKIYETIRNNGGWENWDMVEIAKYNCKDATEARIKEQEHFEEVKSSLNSCPPYVDKNKYYCEICKIQCETNSDYKIHIESNKHTAKAKLTGDNENMPVKFYCDVCDYGCCKKSSWNQHLLTSKHAKAKIELMPANKIYACENCNTVFKHQSSYCRHKKNCIKEINVPSNENNNILDKELIIMLVKQNTELMDMLKNTSSNQANNNTNSLNNNNNKTFNLQFFLNETCKDAMNIMDFVDSIKLQLSDLEKVGEIGYTQGISNIITTNLKALDVTQRPVHCTDKKRETMYIKDENKWEKEDEQNTKLRKVIRRVANKNMRLLPVFREKYPEYNNSSSKISDKYDKIALEATGGFGGDDKEKEEKIIHNISKCVIIDKYMDES